MDAFRIKNLTLPHKLILAPMCGITIKPFRKICKENGAGLVFNQMISAKALTLRDKKSLHLLSFDRNQEGPIGIQLFGYDPHTLAEACQFVEGYGADIVDLNLGCPAKKIVNDGGGSALMTDEKKLKEIFKKMRQAIKGVFTIKIRSGWDEKNKNAITIAALAQEEGIDAITIHARTRAQGYSGRADWQLIKDLKSRLKIPVIGNGDITSASEAHRMLLETGCDAVMTGRAAFSAPWIFDHFIQRTHQNPAPSFVKNLILRQYEYFMDFFGKENGIKMMRKFICAYSKHKMDGASFRQEIMTLTDWSAIQEKLHSFFNQSHSHGLIPI